MNYLSKYNPHTPIFQHFQVDENLSDEDKAFTTWKALLSAKRNHDGLFLVIGSLLKSIRDNKLYEFLDYESFSQFLASDELGFSREKAYMCIKTFEYFIEYLSLDPDYIGKMNISRLSAMVPVLKQIDDKEQAIKKLEEMSSLRHGDFIKSLEREKKSSAKGRPTVFYSEETNKWQIKYYTNTTEIFCLGDYTDEQ